MNAPVPLLNSSRVYDLSAILHVIFNTKVQTNLYAGMKPLSVSLSLLFSRLVQPRVLMSIRPLAIPFGIALSALDKTVPLRYLLRIDLAEDIMLHYFASGRKRARSLNQEKDS